MSKKGKMNRKPWTEVEIKDLMTFVDEKEPTVSLKIWSEESKNKRSYNATQFQYYTTRKKMRLAELARLQAEEAQKQENITVQTENMSGKQEKGALSNHHWSGDEDRQLLTYIQEGKTDEQIADLMHRSKGGIYNRRWRLTSTRSVRKSSGPTTITRTPVREYIAAHPELLPAQTAAAANLAPVELVSGNAIASALASVMVGTVIRLPIVGVRIEGNEVLIQF